MNFSEQFLQSLHDRLNLSEVIGAHVRLRRQGREHIGLCPFHKEKTPSFTVNDQDGLYYCFGCGAGGNAITFLTEKEKMNFPEAVEFLANKAGVPLPKQYDQTPETTFGADIRDTLYNLTEEVAKWFCDQLYTPAGKPIRDYITKRDIAEDMQRAFRLGFAPNGNLLKKEFLSRGYTEADLIRAGLLVVPDDESKDSFDRFRNRVMFPILDRKGRPIAFGGRIIGDGQPKYLNSPETPIFSKSHQLYGLSNAISALKAKGEAIIVEGYIDVIALYQAGYQGAVAPLGTALTEFQLRELWRYCDEPILCFDGDAAGQKAAQRATLRSLSFLKPGKSLRFIQLPAGEDPDSLVKNAPETWAQLLSHPKPLFEQFWTMETMGRSFKTPEQKAFVRNEILSHISTIADKSIQGLYRQEAFKRFNDKHTRPKGSHYAIQTSGGVYQKFDATQKQMTILLATIINHPQILHQVEEQLIHLEITNTLLLAVRNTILDCFHENADTTTEVLRNKLQEKGLQNFITTIDKQDVLMHASFIKLGVCDEEALAGWHDLWETFIHPGDLKKDLNNLKESLSKDLTPQSWERYKTMTEEILRQKQ
jgi:DNA primase